MYGLEMVTRLIVMIILQYIQVLNHCVVHLKLTCFMIIIQKKITETVRCEITKNQIEMLKYDLKKKKKAYLETLVKKPRLPGTGGQTHFIRICQSQLVLIVQNTAWC